MIDNDEQVHVMTEKDKHRRTIDDLGAYIDMMDSYSDDAYLKSVMDGLKDIKKYLEENLL